MHLSQQTPPNNPKTGTREAALERALLEKFLKRKGYRLKDLSDLPEEEAKALMTEASRYASLKLAVMDSTASFREKIHRPD